MGWVVEFLNRTVAAEIEALPNDMRAKFLRIVQISKDAYGRCG
jgi:hypothetical protein